MKYIPRSAKGYILLAAFFILLPTLNGLYAGQENRFLLVSPVIGADGVFHQTVVYIEKHDLLTGARGYIVNRPVPGRENVFYGGLSGQPEHIVTIDFGEERRTFQGYARWVPLLLEYEMMRGIWSVVPDGDRVAVFSDDYKGLWRDLDVRVREAPHLRDNPVY